MRWIFFNHLYRYAGKVFLPDETFSVKEDPGIGPIFSSEQELSRIFNKAVFFYKKGGPGELTDFVIPDKNC